MKNFNQGLEEQLLPAILMKGSKERWHGVFLLPCFFVSERRLISVKLISITPFPGNLATEFKICPVDVEEIIKDVDWVTILFFSALFMLVGTIEHLGLIHMLANFTFSVIGDNFKLLSISLVWGSGFISAIVDNVPYTAAVIPLVKEIASMVPGSSDFLWWSLALGACFGGNGTLVGASANLVMAGIAEKSGLKIDFWSYLARGGIIMIATLAVSSVYIFIRYL